jgi:uncharacterized protein (TIGR00106 family)
MMFLVDGQPAFRPIGRAGGRRCRIHRGGAHFDQDGLVGPFALVEPLRRIPPMHVIIDLCVVPLGVGVSVSEYVAACERVIREAGLKASLHAYGTNVEGDWDAVMAAVKRCHEVVHAMGAPRISTTIKLGTRTDRAQSMEDKVRSVERKLQPDQG